MQTECRSRQAARRALPWLLLFALPGCLIVCRQLAAWPVWRVYLQSFTMLSIGLLLEALPFVLLGCLVSSAVQHYLSDQALVQLLPRNYYGALLAASLLGLCFPVGGLAAPGRAERLLHKGVPVGVTTTFLLAAPTVNPIVLSATYRAFGGSLVAVLLRAICGWLLALFVGDVIGRSSELAWPLRQIGFYQRRGDETQWRRDGRPSLADVLQHAGDQVLEIAPWLIGGTLLLAALRLLLPVVAPNGVGGMRFLTIPACMLLAFLASFCAEADAFLARACLGWFPGGALLAFLLIGPVLNLRNALQLPHRLQPVFVRRLLGWGAAWALVTAVVANLFGF